MPIPSPHPAGTVIHQDGQVEHFASLAEVKHQPADECWIGIYLHSSEVEFKNMLSQGFLISRPFLTTYNSSAVTRQRQSVYPNADDFNEIRTLIIDAIGGTYDTPLPEIALVDELDDADVPPGDAFTGAGAQDSASTPGARANQRAAGEQGNSSSNSSRDEFAEQSSGPGLETPDAPHDWVTKAITLKQANAGELARVLQEQFGNPAKIISEPKSNTILIRVGAMDLPAIEAVISVVDAIDSPMSGAAFIDEKGRIDQTSTIQQLIQNHQKPVWAIIALPQLLVTDASNLLQRKLNVRTSS